MSLNKWIGNDTINRWRSNSAFGSGSDTSSLIGVKKNEGEKDNQDELDAQGENDLKEDLPEGGNDEKVFLTPTRNKRRLSPNTETPIGIMRKISTGVSKSTIQRLRFEYWSEDEGLDDAIGRVNALVMGNDENAADPT